MSPVSLIKDVFYRLAMFIPQPKNAACIIMYHSISDAPLYSAVTPERFEEQMRILHEGAFNVVSLEQLAHYRAERRIPPKTVCITFDDGYKDNFTHAFPILMRYKLPATIFVATARIGDKTWARRGVEFEMMTEEDIRQIDRSRAVSIESHTSSHPKLTHVSSEEAEAEVRKGKEDVERLVGRPSIHFAYPHGRHDSDSCAAVKRAGIMYAYTTHEGLVHPGDDPLRLHRNGINRTITNTQFKGTLLYGRLSRARLRAYLFGGR